jgi:hypothetical protein
VTKKFCQPRGGCMKASSLVALSCLLVLLPAPSADAAKKKKAAKGSFLERCLISGGTVKGGQCCYDEESWGEPLGGGEVCSSRPLFRTTGAPKRLYPTPGGLKSGPKGLYPIPGGLKGSPRGPMSVAPIGPRIPSVIPRRR